MSRMPTFSIPSQASFQSLGCLLVVCSLKYGHQVAQKDGIIRVVLSSMKDRVLLLNSFGPSVLWSLFLVLLSSEVCGASSRNDDDKVLL